MTNPTLPDRYTFLRNGIAAVGECTICLEPFDSTHIPAYFSQPRYCKHMFGETCLRQWVSNSNQCPVCRCTLYRSNARNQDGETQAALPQYSTPRSRSSQNTPPRINQSNRPNNSTRSRASGGPQPRGNHPQPHNTQDVAIDDPDVEPELFVEHFGRELKGNIILALYREARADRSLVREAIRGDTKKMWECMWQVIRNDAVGSYFLSQPGGIGARPETEAIILELLVEMILAEDLEPLSWFRRELWIDEMCERTEGVDSNNEDDEDQDQYGIY